jgi:polar amino acid transport system substrate-binding protein
MMRKPSSRSARHALLYGALCLCLAASLPAAARTLLIATSSSIPPYVITDQHRGIVVDILRDVLQMSGHEIEFVYAPNRRVEHMIEERQVDGVYNLAQGALASVYYSDPIVDYHNVAITREQFSGDITSLSDLIGLRVVVFQNAEKFLGAEFEQLMQSSQAFPEVSNQRSQVLMLFRGRADVIIMERRIFEYFFQQLSASGEIGGGYRIHPLFEPAPRYAAFLDRNLRDEFNAGLKVLRESGRLRAIIERYLGSPVTTP